MNKCRESLICLIVTATLLNGVLSSAGNSCSTTKAEIDELSAKIEDLERQLYLARTEADRQKLTAEELRNDVIKQTTELNYCAEGKANQEEAEKLCEKKLSKIISKMPSVHREATLNRKLKIRCEGFKEKLEDDLKMQTIELEKAQAQAATCSHPSTAGEEFQLLTDKMTNCEETLKVVRDRCDRDSADLNRIRQTHDRFRKNLESCTENLKTCEATKDHLEFLKKGYDIVVKELERDQQVAKDEKDKSEASAKVAIQGASKYQLYLTAVGVLALAGGTVKAYGYVKAKMAERMAALAVEKQKLKAEGKRKGGSEKTKHKQT